MRESDRKQPERPKQKRSSETRDHLIAVESCWFWFWLLQRSPALVCVRIADNGLHAKDDPISERAQTSALGREA